MKNGKQVSLLRVGTVLLALLILLAAACLVSMAVGSAGYSVPEILRALFSEENPPSRRSLSTSASPHHPRHLNRRLPRGGGRPPLQSVMRNPLADPGTIGVSAGAGTAATTILLLLPEPHLVGAAVRLRGRGAGLRADLHDGLEEGVDPTRIILSGVAINSVLGAYNSLLQLLNSDSLEGVLAFMNGSLSGRSWPQVRLLSVYASIGLVLAFLCIKSAKPPSQLGGRDGQKPRGQGQRQPGAFIRRRRLPRRLDRLGRRHDRVCRAGGPAYLPAAGRLRL